MGAGRVIAATVVLAGGVTSVVLTTGGGGGGVPESTAHLWVDTDGGTCTRQSTPGAYNDAAACTLANSYTTAQSGDTVGVLSGEYGDWELTGQNKTVTFRGEDGATVSGLGVYDNNITVNNIDVDNEYAQQTGVYLDGVSNFTFTDAFICCVTDEKGVLAGGQVASTPLNILFDNVVFRDVLVTDELVHNECFYNQAAGLTITNSEFYNCATMDLFVTRGTSWGQEQYGDLTLINNVFGAPRVLNGGCCHFYSLGFNGGSVLTAMTDWYVVHNTFEAQSSANGDAPGTVWANNLGEWGDFDGDFISTGNVGTVNSGTDTSASIGTIQGGWVSPYSTPDTDFHLEGDSVAINAADPDYSTGVSATDKDGVARDGTPDAGAYAYVP